MTLRARSGERTSARTARLRAKSLRTTAFPTRPVAPVTRVTATWSSGRLPATGERQLELALLVLGKLAASLLESGLEGAKLDNRPRLVEPRLEVVEKRAVVAAQLLYV